MVTFSGNEFYFDEFEQDISDGSWFDSIVRFDARAAATVTGSPKFSFKTERYETNEIGTLVIRERYIGLEDYSKFIDLMRLVPTKFRGSELLQQFIYEIGLDVGTWVGDVNDLEKLLDPNYVPIEYLPYLAELIGLEIISDETTSDDAKRQQLLQAIELYRIKGTYQSLIRAAYLAGANVTMWDNYCSSAGAGSEINYNAGSFVNASWYAGPLGSNPPGLDSTYFKTPHLGVSTALTTVYGTYPDEYLYSSATSNVLLPQYVERVRPVNVVVHYIISLYAETDTTGTVYTMPGRVATCCVDGWAFPGLNFDVPHDFDDGNFFDQSPIVALQAINRWKLGTGSKNTPPSPSGWNLQNPTPGLLGSVNAIRIYGSYAEYDIHVPVATVQPGISELGLYLVDDTTIKIGCTFPDIDLDGSVELNITVKFYFA